MILKDAQRLGVTTTAVQGCHQQRERTFSQWLLGDHPLEVRHDVVGRADRKTSGGKLFERDQTLLFQMPGVGLGPRFVGELEQRPAPPQAERLVQQRNGALLVASRQRRPAAGQRHLESSTVDQVAIGHEHVAG